MKDYTYNIGTKVTTEWGVYYIGKTEHGKYYARSDENPQFCFAADTLDEATELADSALRVACKSHPTQSIRG
jgi:predicted RNase H-like HicB family nuclease